MGSFLLRVFPFLAWFKESIGASLRADFIAGLTVALVLIPQSMAYAQLAGLPPYYGLYAAFLPPMIASLFGSSRQLATGPVAVVSLMTAAALEPIATAGSEAFISYAILLALMVGMFQFMLGVLRLGLVVNFLSHPVVNGFTCAAAIIIATSQLTKIFGVYVDKSEHHYETIYRVVLAAIHYTHWPTLAMAVLAFTTMICLKKKNPKIPNVLVAVVITTVLAVLLGFEKNETIGIDRIESPEVREKMRRFNAAVKKRQEFEALRAETQKTLAEMIEKTTHEGTGTCAQCHTPRDIEGFTTAEGPPDRSGRAAAIHQMAGLIDAHMKELRKQASATRTELRDLHFGRVEGDDGKNTFHLLDKMPEDTKGDSGLWRIKIGGHALETDRITMMGGGAVVGTIPVGLPSLKVPQAWEHLGILLKLIPVAIIISILGFREAISIAKAMAAKSRQKLDPNQELIGQGLANIVGCCGQSYACSGSFSRSAVNFEAGAITGLSNVFSSAIVVVVLLFLTPLLYHLPQAVLAAIIMMAVIRLLNVSGIVDAWRVQKFDGVAGIVTFVGTLAFAPHLEYGLFMGIMLSLGGYLIRTMRPKVVQLSPHPDGSLRDSERHELDRCKHLAVIRFSGPLNFASISYLEDEVLGRVASMPELKSVLIDGEGINEMDASGEEMLRNLVRRLRSGGFQVAFSGLKDEIQDVLKRAHLDEVIGEENVYPTQAQALAGVYGAAHQGHRESECPFHTVMARVTEISLHPDGSLRDARRRQLPVCEHIAILRFDDPLSFANTGLLEAQILEMLSDRPKLKHVMFGALGITEIDQAAAEKLGQVVTKLRDKGYEVAFSSFKDHVLDALAHTDTLDKIGRDHIYPTQTLAVTGIYLSAHENSEERDCPLQPLLPHVTALSLHEDGSLRDADRHRLDLCQHIAAIRFDGPLNFATTNFLDAKLFEHLEGRNGVKHVLIAAHGINTIDTRAAEWLCQLIERLQRKAYEVSFSGFKEQVLDVLRGSDACLLLDEEDIYPTQALAVAGIYPHAHAGSDELSCPLRPLLPHVRELSLHADGSLRDARRHGLKLCRHIAVIRFDGPLNFATMGHLETELLQQLETRKDVKHVLIAAHGLNEIDTRAADRLCLLVERLRQENYDVSFSGVKDNVLDVLRVTENACAIIGDDDMFPTQAFAVAGIYPQAHAGSDEKDCPLLPMMPHVTELSLHPDGSLREAQRHGLKLCKHIAAIRFDGPLNFSTMEYFEFKILSHLKGRECLKHVLIASHGISGIGVRASARLAHLVRRLRGDGYEVSFSGFKDEVLDVLQRTKTFEAIGAEHVYPTQALAVEAIYPASHEGSDEGDCPLRKVVYDEASPAAKRGS